MQSNVIIKIYAAEQSEVTFFSKTNNKLYFITRMHSSRMRTVCSSSRLFGVGVCPERGVCLGVSSRGCLPIGGCVYSSMHWGRHPPPVDRMTDRCKNITFPQLRLRTVIKTSNPLLISKITFLGLRHMLMQ